MVARGDTRIFSRAENRLRLHISLRYRGVRCPVCSTVQDFAELIHAKLTHTFASIIRFHARAERRQRPSLHLCQYLEDVLSRIDT
jgi:hypothetical protein